MKRLVYRDNECSFCKRQYTNQVFENGKWKFINRFIGKFGARPIVWYDTKEWAEKFSTQDDEISEMIEWDGVDEEGYQNEFHKNTKYNDGRIYN